MTSARCEREPQRAIRPALLRLLLLLGGALAALVLGLAGPAWAAEAPVVTAPASPGATASATWSFTYDAAAGDATCTLSKGAVLETRTPCTSPATFALGAGDGEYGFAVVVGDSAPGTSSYTLDRSPPPAATVSGPTGPSRSTTPTFHLSGGEQGAVWTCAVTPPRGQVTRFGCGEGPLSLTLSSGDGRYALAVTLTDAAGNASTTTVTYDLDTKSLSAPTITGPTGPSPDRAPVFVLGAEEGVTWSCMVTGPNGTFDAGCSTGTWVFDLATAADGTYTGTLTVSKQGRTSPATVHSYTLDTTAPAAPGVSGPSGPSSVTAPTFTLSGESGASFSCTLTSPTGAVTTPACAAGAFTPQLAGDGTWTLAVTQTDRAGHPSPATTRTYALQTAAPSVDVSGPSGPSTDRAPAFTITSDGSPVSCVLVSPSGTQQALTCGPGELRLSLPAGGDGLWTLRVTATAGSGTTAVASATYRLDTTAPAAGLSGPPGPSKALGPVFTVTGEAGAGYACSLTSPGGAVQALPCAAGSLQLSLPAGADGPWTVRVTVTDAAGNAATASATYLLDTAAPAAGVSGPPGPAQALDPAFTVTAEPGAAVSCTLTSPSGVVQALACAAGPLQLALPAGGDGLWTVRVTVTDPAGNAATATATYRLDTTAPAVGVSGPSGPSSDRTPTYVLSAEPGATVACTLTPPGGTPSALACAAGALELSLPSGQDGTWTLRVTATDAAGNSATTTVTYRLDTAAPTVDVTGPTGPSRNLAPVFSLSGETGGAYACTLTGPNGVATPLDCAAGPLTLSLPADGDGTWTLRVSLTGAAGTTGTASAVYRLDRSAPTVTVTGPAGPSRDLRPLLVLAGEPGTAFTCTLTAPGGTAQPIACAEGALQLVLPAGGDGGWLLRVTGTDAAGNPVTVTHTYLLDTAAPPAGVTGPGAASNDRSPSFTLTGEAGAAYGCLLTSPSGASFQVECVAGLQELLLPAGPDGTWTLRVTVTDEAGNDATATATYLLDTALPAAAVTGSAGPSRTLRAVFTVTGEDGAAFTCALTAPDGSVTSVPCTAGTLQLDLVGADGTWTLRLTVTDAAGNASTATAGYLLDTTAPDVVLGGSDGAWSVRVDGGVVVVCVLVSSEGTEQPVDCSSGAVNVALADLAPGSWLLRVTASDEAENVRVAERGFLVAASAPPPAAPPVSSPPAQEAPPREPPAEEPAVEEPPAEEPPVEEPPAVQPPVVQPPVVEPPAVQIPTVQPPAEQPPVGPAPAPEPPAVDVVVPAGEVQPAPVEEPATPAAPQQEPSLVERLPAAVDAVVPALTAPLRVLAGAVAEGATPRVVQRLAAAADLQTRWRATLRLLGDAAAVGGVPVLLLLLVVTFLSLQNRIDRNDPKLALAPVHAHQALPFRPMERVAT